MVGGGGSGCVNGVVLLGKGGGGGDQSFNIRSKMESNENITLSRDKIK